MFNLKLRVASQGTHFITITRSWNVNRQYFLCEVALNLAFQDASCTLRRELRLCKFRIGWFHWSSCVVPCKVSAKDLWKPIHIQFIRSWSFYKHAWWLSYSFEFLLEDNLLYVYLKIVIVIFLILNFLYPVSYRSSSD